MYVCSEGVGVKTKHKRSWDERSHHPPTFTHARFSPTPTVKPGVTFVKTEIVSLRKLMLGHMILITTIQGTRRRRLPVVDPTSWAPPRCKWRQAPPPIGSGEAQKSPGFRLRSVWSRPGCSVCSSLYYYSGINPNPGPGPYFCSPCSFRTKRTQPSVWCHICGYIHLKCSGLTHLNQHHPDYYCPTCTSTYILPPPGTRSSNLTTPNSQTCSTSLTAPQPHLPSPPPPPTLPTSSNNNSSSQNCANRNRVKSVNNSSSNNHFNHTAVNNVNSSPHPAKGLLKILQFNCNGISGKAPEIAAFLPQNQIHIAVFQETKLRKKSRNPSLGSHYTLIRKDREKEGGGLLIAIHESIQYEEININNDGTLEAMGISVVASSSKLRIYNFYIPPRSSCPPGYSASLAELLEPGDALVLGHANAHSQLWNSNIEEDQRGSVLSNEITESTFAPLNDDTQTRVPFNSENQLSSPDISLASQSLLLSISWTPIKSLGSDHLPILLELPLDDF